MNLDLYIDYFRQLAISHKDIRHSESSETQDAPPDSFRFATYNASDVVMKRLRTKVGFPALLAEIFEVDIQSNTALAPRGAYIGGFMILDHAKANNYPDELRALASTEIIAWQILQRIWNDHFGPNKSRCTRPFADIDFNRINIVAVGPVFDNEFGWRVEFGFKPKTPLNLTDPVADGVFLP